MTALGIDNKGAMVYRYGYELDDCADGTEVEVFRESDSTFYQRIKNLFGAELKTLYGTLESKGAWSANSLITQFDEWQAQFPEELWRLWIERAYLRTYSESFIGGAGNPDFLKTMAHGKKKYQRRQYERNQEQYYASKFQTSVNSGGENKILMRCTVPSDNVVVEPNFSITITPYYYMYINIKYGTASPLQMRAEPNKPYTIPVQAGGADIIEIHGAKSIQSLGDLSACYPDTLNVTTASKLKELIVGNNTPGYDNPYLNSLSLGANALLETLNIENCSGLTTALDLIALYNLKNLYAEGSSISGVAFADGGRLEIAELPAINTLSMKNLIYLIRMDVASFNQLLQLTVENCDAIDVIEVLNAAPNLHHARILGIDWDLDSTDLLDRLYEIGGYDKNGGETDHAVLTGKVHVPVVKQQQLYEFNQAWPDLEISYDSLVEQFAVTFQNEDGTVLEVQYVDIGQNATDPATRTENRIIPTKTSTVSHDFTFAGWDTTLNIITSDRVIKATYTSSLRSYTIKYMSKNTVMQESTDLYGANVPYVGSTPVYTAEETMAYKYYLFSRWDKSGFIDGEKTVNAVFDSFQYVHGCFEGKELADLSPIEIYALTKLNAAGVVTIVTTEAEKANLEAQDKEVFLMEDLDTFSFTIGNDIDYDDIDTRTLISSPVSFTGTNYVDTGVKLFDQDRDFVLAFDYEMPKGNPTNATIAQCYQGNGSVGFRLYNNNGLQLAWGSSADQSGCLAVDKREMMVIRHLKGSNEITVYHSSLDSDAPVSYIIDSGKSTIINSTLVFGCAKADDGAYESHATGAVHWAKVWYCDLGDETCRDLAIWTHEEMTMGACGLRRFYLSDGSNGRCTFTLLANHLLSRTKQWNTGNTDYNSGGWATSDLNYSLNNRLYKAFPIQIRQLTKQVNVMSSIGDKSTEISTSPCYITIPAYAELYSGATIAPYPQEMISSATTISYMSSDDARRRAFANGTYAAYWTRTPNVGYSNYVWYVSDVGKVSGIRGTGTPSGVLIMISF